MPGRARKAAIQGAASAAASLAFAGRIARASPSYSGEAAGELIAVGGQRALGVARGPLPRGLLVHLAPDADVAAKRRAHLLALDGAAAQRDHIRPSGAEQLQHRVPLATAELGLALALEERGDRLAEAGLDQLVGVGDVEAEVGAERPRGAALPRGHEPDEDDRGAGRVRSRYLRHPIRSS